ncbi:MAG: CoA transferase [Gammaproteobacteria bacterium]|nr:CoA transferase [Gammaproteobacteria bacterium]
MTKTEKLINGGPLADLRVIEMGVLLAGPFCGQLLGDYGAEVIKIEQPGVGDPMRDWGQEKPHGKSLWWPVIARNKKSITLNAREKEGQEIIKELVKDADILIENFRPGTMEKWNLGYEELSKINPGLIMVRVTGFGQSGPYSPQAGYGSIGEAMGGLRYIIGEPDRPPSRAGISIGDALAATFGTLGALTAIHARETTGRGQVVDSAIYEAVFGMMESLIPEYQHGGYVRERTGSILPNVAPANAYPTKDGEYLIAANQDTVFKRLAAAMGQPELADDERYATHGARGDVQQELDDMVSDWTRTMTSAELREKLNEHGVPNGKIFTAPDMLEDEHYAARDAIVSIPHKIFDNIKMQNVFPKMSETQGKVRWAGPELGEHNDHVYGDILNMDESTIKDYKEKGII